MSENSSREVHGIHCTKSPIDFHYTKINCLDKYENIKLFQIEYVAQLLINPFISYPDMKIFYPIQVNDLWFQIQ